MRICLGCLRRKAWSVFPNRGGCFLCTPYGGPSHLFNKAEERGYRRLSRAMGWGPGSDDRMPSSRDLDAVDALRLRILKGSGEGDPS